ncbi:uncharacterized protein LOC128932267 isoform X3 [Callithrix jacchus]|uniref:uncharacterized protein LOC128932267 isoform X2 n=1 Tax=Callithrix jacchus TaxID=9483 RepID=UPI0023DCFCC1|nr:uncharacterized protein LOC128932267 isoform X2 [Callithrix jacchus]
MGQVTSLLCLHPPSLLAVPLLSLQSRQHKQQLKCEKQDPERGDHLNPVLELLCVPGFGEFLGTQEEERFLEMKEESVAMKPAPFLATSIPGHLIPSSLRGHVNATRI